MSETHWDLALTLIPADMHFRPAPDAAQRALAMFTELFRGASDHQAKTFEAAHFINPELFASKAFCPTCGAASERYGEPGEAQRLWFANIDRVTLDAPVETMRTVLPACGHEVPFTALTFDWPAGCARFALVATYEYWDDEVMYQPLEAQMEAQIEALGAALGTPVKVVRSYFTLLPSNRRLFEALMSPDEAARVAAAQALDALEQGHFEDHTISARFPEDNVDRLLAAFHASRNRDVRAWVLRALSRVKTHTPALVETVAAHLGPDDPLLESCLHMVYLDFKRYAHLTQTLIALRHHADRDIRWRCAMALARWPLEEAGVLDALHGLMLDADEGTRRQAVGALEYRRRVLMLDGRRELMLDDASRAVLEKVIAMDAKSGAAFNARKLLEGAGK